MSDDRSSAPPSPEPPPPPPPAIVFQPPARLLAVDDSPLNLRLIESIFPPPSYEVYKLAENRHVFTACDEFRPEVILLDVMMPGNDGFTLCQQLQATPETATVPVIFITARDSIRDRLAGFEAGGVDYVAKPFNQYELTARVNLHVRLQRMTRERETLAHLALEERREAGIVRLAAGVSHNFSNLLGVTLGNLMFLERQLGLAPAPLVAEALADLRESLLRQQKIVRQFMYLTDRGRIARSDGAPCTEAVPLATLIAEIIDGLAYELPHGPQRWRMDIQPEAAICCDPGHAREIFNLLITEMSAIAMADTRLDLSVETVSSGQVMCRIAGEPLPLPSDIEDIIFEPFALPLANVGTGLAFAVAKRLIDLNHGTITAATPRPGAIAIAVVFPSP